MTVIRVHELAKKMTVESKDLITVLEKMGIKGKTPSSGLDEKETKSLIEKLKAVRKEKEKEKVKKEKDPAAEAVVLKEERLKKAAALIGKFSSTLEKPGTKPKPVPVPPLPKPVIPAPPVIPPAGQMKPVQAQPAITEEGKKTPTTDAAVAEKPAIAAAVRPGQSPSPEARPR